MGGWIDVTSLTDVTVVTAARVLAVEWISVSCFFFHNGNAKTGLTQCGGEGERTTSNDSPSPSHGGTAHPHLSNFNLPG